MAKPKKGKDFSDGAMVEVSISKEVPVEEYVDGVLDVVENFYPIEDRELMAAKIVERLVTECNEDDSELAARIVDAVNGHFSTKFAAPDDEK